MEVDGMYENTPWERLSLWAPWIGLAVVAAMVVLYVIARHRRVKDTDGASAAMYIAQLVGVYALSFATLGGLFTVMWRPAHDTYPHAFGRAALGVAVGVLVIAGIVAMVRRSLIPVALIYGPLTAAACVAAAIAAFSHSIIAEGQVTAMVLPVGYVAAALIAATVAAPWYRDARRYEAAMVIAFVGLAYFASTKLPVVQFRPDDSMYPVIGGLYIVVVGRLARARSLPHTMAAAMAAATVAIGYLVGWWYGIAIAAVGLSISGAWGLRHPTSEEFRLPHSVRE